MCLLLYQCRFIQFSKNKATEFNHIVIYISEYATCSFATKAQASGAQLYEVFHLNDEPSKLNAKRNLTNQRFVIPKISLERR